MRGSGYLPVSGEQGTQVPLLPASVLPTPPAAVPDLFGQPTILPDIGTPLPPAPGAPKGPVSRGLAAGFCRSQWGGNRAHCPATAPARPGSVREAGLRRAATLGWPSQWPLRTPPPDLTLWVFFSSRPQFCIGLFSLHLICFLPGPAIGSGCNGFVFL